MYPTKATLMASVMLFVHSGLTGQDPVVEVEGVIAIGVEDREAVSPGTAFPADVGQLFAWTRVTGAANTTIEHVWKHGELEFVVPLTIGGSPWRTWTSKAIPLEWAGAWTFEVRDAGGNVVFETAFTVGDGS